MASSKKYKLTKKGSVTRIAEKSFTVQKGEIIGEEKFKRLPEHQQKFFDEQGVKSEEEEASGGLAGRIGDDFTVEQLHDELTEFEVDYPSDARKSDLVSLYMEHVAEAEPKTQDEEE